MAEPASAYGKIIASCLLEETAWSMGLHIRSVQAYEASPGVLGWRVSIPLLPRGIAKVGIVSQVGDNVGAPTWDVRVFDGPADVAAKKWDVYLVNATTGALLPKSTMDAGSFVSFVVVSTDGESGAVLAP